MANMNSCEVFGADYATIYAMYHVHDMHDMHSDKQ